MVERTILEQAIPDFERAMIETVIGIHWRPEKRRSTLVGLGKKHSDTQVTGIRIRVLAFKSCHKKTPLTIGGVFSFGHYDLFNGLCLLS